MKRLDYTASDHVKAIYDHMERAFINTILVNNEDIPTAIQERYSEEAGKARSIMM